MGNKTALIEQKQVNFDGAEILAVKTNDGKLRVGVRWVCDGIGLTDGQYQNQTRKINNDVVLVEGVAKIQLPTAGGNQEVLTLELDYLPLWLAKINANIITDKVVQEKLIKYQLKAKDVLAGAFIGVNTSEEQPAAANNKLEEAIKLFNQNAKYLPQTTLNAAFQYLWKELTGVYLIGVSLVPTVSMASTTPAPVLTLVENWYTTTEIAKLAGVSIQKVAKTASKHNLRTDKYCKLQRKRHDSLVIESVVYDRSVKRSSLVQVMYNEAGKNKLLALLKQNNREVNCVG